MLTKKQYEKNYTILHEYITNLLKDYTEKELEEEDIKKLIRELFAKKAKELNLQYKTRADGRTRIFAPEDVYKDIIVTKDVIVPREERISSCDVAILSKNFKNQMLGSIDYTNNTNREVYYELCDTPKGKKMTSPSFGDKKSVQTSKYQCQTQFGVKSKPIAEFHTHPIKHDDLGGFSGGDLLSFFNSPPEKINCVVKEVKVGNEKSVRVRCAKTQDVKNFMETSEWKHGKTVTPKNQRAFGDALEAAGEKAQEKFSCFVDFPLGYAYKERPEIKELEKKRAPKLYKKTYGKKTAKKNSGEFKFG